MYYIAYGSNLNIKQMKIRCPDSSVVGTSVLKDFQLLFKGSIGNAYLTIEPCEGSEVPVAIWEISENDETQLDLYEGYPELYYKALIEVQVNDKNEDCLIYIMNPEFECSICSEDYFNSCKQGYRDFNFDLNVLDHAIDETVERVLYEF